MHQIAISIYVLCFHLTFGDTLSRTYIPYFDWMNKIKKKKRENLAKQGRFNSIRAIKYKLLYVGEIDIVCGGIISTSESIF